MTDAERLRNVIGAAVRLGNFFAMHPDAFDRRPELRKRIDDLTAACDVECIKALDRLERGQVHLREAARLLAFSVKIDLEENEAITDQERMQYSLDLANWLTVENAS